MCQGTSSKKWTFSRWEKECGQGTTTYEIVLCACVIPLRYTRVTYVEYQKMKKVKGILYEQKFRVHTVTFLYGLHQHTHSLSL